LRLSRYQVLYRVAVETFSPTLPLGGYVGCRGQKRRNPIGFEADLELDIQVSRGGKPGLYSLEVATASRYLIKSRVSL
jgi:hypothetical protein